MDAVFDTSAMEAFEIKHENWKFDGCIACGRFGSVVKIQEVTTEMHRALKMINIIESTEKLNIIASSIKTLDEAEIQYNCRHPNIIRCFFFAMKTTIFICVWNI